jgi:nicotinamidase/pyrazinamidase
VSQALIIVDVQNDFTPPDGALAVPHGDEVIAPINELAASVDFDLVIATRDWHPPDHASFRSQGGIWPRHCVRDTPGAQLDRTVDRGLIDAVIDKGTSQAAPGYSAFESTPLRALLAREGVDEVTITGLATEFCVKQTALDALRHGLKVTIPLTAVRGIEDDDSTNALDELAAAGAEIWADATDASARVPRRAGRLTTAPPGS